MEKIKRIDKLRISMMKNILKIFKRYLIDKVPLYNDDYYEYLKRMGFFEIKNEYGCFYKIKNKLSEKINNDIKIKKYFFNLFKEKIYFNTSLNDYDNISLIQERFILAENIYNIIHSLYKNVLNIASIIGLYVNIQTLISELDIDSIPLKNYKAKYLELQFYKKSNNKYILYNFIVDFRGIDKKNKMPIAEIDFYNTEINYEDLDYYLFNSFLHDDMKNIINLYDTVYDIYKEEIQDLIKTIFQNILNEINNLEMYLMFKSIDFSNDNHIKIIMESLRNKDVDKTNKTVEGFLKKTYKKIKGGFELC